MISIKVSWSNFGYYASLIGNQCTQSLKLVGEEDIWLLAKSCFKLFTMIVQFVLSKCQKPWPIGDSSNNGRE